MSPESHLGAKAHTGSGKIAVSFSRLPHSAEELKTLDARGGDLFELRLDLAARTARSRAISKMAAAFAGWPLIVTARSKAEGGTLNCPEKQARLLMAAASNASAIDLELASQSFREEIRAAANAHGCELILSHHDLATTPPLAELNRLMDEAFAAGADLFKLTTTTSTPEHIEILAEVLAQAKRASRKIAVMGMGKLAGVSRLRLAREGSQFVFACISEAESTATGQPTLDWLAERLAQPKD